MKKKWLKISGVLGVLLLALFLYQYFGLNHYLSLEYLKNHQNEFNEYYNQNLVLVILYFSLIYIVSVAFSFPGASILTLAAGAIFGFRVGTLIVSLSSTIGATLAFWASRYFFKDFVEGKFKSKFDSINSGIEKEGIFYLFSLRLLPVFPFFLVNLLMGLTTLPTVTYFWVSLLGMLPGTMVYINAGTEISKIESVKGILSPPMLVSLVLLGVLPQISKFIINWIKLNKHLRKFKKPKSYDYNMIVIGGGSAGLVSSYIAAAVKAKVLLVEKHKMGGDCLNTGCVPSKAIIKSAKVANILKHSNEFGIDAKDIKIDFKKVMERVQDVIRKVEPHDSVERFSGLGVECLKGTAFIKSPYEVEVDGKMFTTKNIVVATGAGPLVPPIPGLSEIDYLTSNNVWSLRELPQRLIVLGGGPIGSELAQSFARLGAKVTQVEMAPQIMGREDAEVSKLVTEQFSRDGITVLTSHKALRIDSKNKILVCEFQGQEISIEFDKILVALGRKANVKGFGLENLNIEISNRGTVVADEYLRTTNYPNIYVCGDVTGPYQFTHTAAHQAWFVAVNALFGIFKKFKVDYRIIPWSTFVDPEVARVGLNEKEAKKQGIDYQISKFDIEELDRAIADSEDHGFIKVLTKRGTDKILGVTIVGDHAGDIIGEYVQAMKYGLGMNKILGTIHIYPTLAESNKYVAGVWKKQNSPKKLLEYVKKFHSWRRG
ncbi:MAG: dihydrolipoyl dehydrogenase [Bacteriovorax sp.]|nr:dihydrolipoyl dehydrogenase [Bacteriovorax sp.]